VGTKDQESEPQQDGIEPKGAVQPRPLAGLSDEEVRAYWMEKSLARFRRRTAHLHRPQDGASAGRIVPDSEMQRDPEVEAAIHLPPPEDTKTILRIWRERRLAQRADQAPAAGDQDVVRAKALAKSQARAVALNARKSHGDVGEMTVVDKLPPNDLDWTRGLTTAEIVAGMTRRAVALRAASVTDSRPGWEHAIIVPDEEPRRPMDDLSDDETDLLRRR